MPLTEAELSKLNAAITTALLSQRLDGWQTKFVTDMKHKLTRNGTKTKLSEKQQSKLYEILKPYLTKSPVVQFSKAPPKPRRAQRSPRSRHRRNRVPRKYKRTRTRLFISRKLMLVAVGLLVVIGIYQSDNTPSGWDTGFTPKLPVLETSYSGRLHYHLAIRNPFPKKHEWFETQIRKLWGKTDWGYSGIDIQTGADTGWINYIAKLGPHDEVDWENMHSVRRV